MLMNSFLSTLRREAIRHRVRVVEVSDGDRDSEASWDITFDSHGFYSGTRRELGRLCALLIAQAESDGASRIQFHYGKGRMVYVLNGVDYDMVPPPQPMLVDLVRALAAAARVRWDTPGSLVVRFADLETRLKVAHRCDSEDPVIEITGLSGTPASRTVCV